MDAKTQTALTHYNQWIEWYPGAMDGAAQVAVRYINSERQLAELITAVSENTEPKFRTWVTKNLIDEFNHRNDAE